MDVAAHSSYHHLRAAGRAAGRGGRFLGFDGGSKQLYGFLHYARALDHLREEHASFAEEASHAIHPLHERALHDRKRRPHFGTRLFKQRIQVVEAPFDHCIGESRGGSRCRFSLNLLHGGFASGGGGFGCERDEPFVGIGASAEQRILDGFG